MGLRITTNTQALSAQRYVHQNGDSQARAEEKLSSGSRINRAGDDAAGLSISEKLRAKSRSIGMATRNAGDGISLVQVAEGAMNEVSNMLIRIRELSIHAASDTIGDTERGFLDKEVQHLIAEVDRISNTTEYNGTKLLINEPHIAEIQVGPFNDPEGDRLYHDIMKGSTSTARLGITGVNVASKGGAQTSLGAIDGAITRLNSSRASLGAFQNRLIDTINDLNVSHENVEASKSRIRDTDYATETAELARANILANSSISVLAQANQNNAIALKLLS